MPDIICPYNFQHIQEFQNFFNTQRCEYCNDPRKERKNHECWSVTKLIMTNKYEHCEEAIKKKGVYTYVGKRNFLGIKRAETIKNRIEKFLISTETFYQK